MLQFEIKKMEGLRLAGLNAQMSLHANSTHVLWKRYMQLVSGKAELKEKQKISLQVYSQPMDCMNPRAVFEKWAGYVLQPNDVVPSGFLELRVQGGGYAVFEYHEGAQGAESFFKEVFMNTLPAAKLQLAHRPHFELLAPDYAVSQKEQIWIPVL